MLSASSAPSPASPGTIHRLTGADDAGADREAGAATTGPVTVGWATLGTPEGRTARACVATWVGSSEYLAMLTPVSGELRSW